ncbi:TIGR00341 family protein [Thioflavicoccus mobilis 8321]|uniref:TIGR00341 family protein n=1 Tax=Thioflavicoccus mobilis 8321 TaxID=765912 RepID=L0GTP0_9GAMM|nr:TIGR00341 family protein [Thioflavicoccus mobilis]AGA89361.1 TIGR00341 family protein [Thioflavicoccus mobilis 8321]
MRIVEVVADAKHAKTLAGMARFYGAVDYWWSGDGGDGRCNIRMLMPDGKRQALIDSLQDLFVAADRARIVVQPVDTTLTHEGPAESDGDESKKKKVSSTREELYTQIARGAQLNSNYLILTVLSTFVAAIGLIEDNIAVVIGAMVIAPLLGPNIALAFATSLGDRDLTWRALRTNVAGIAITLAITIAITLLLPVDLDNQAIETRTDVDLGGVVLGLASGAAAVLSLTTGLSATLVGVMVAVALLPPAATMGMMIGAGHWSAAFGAFLLLATNIVCVLLSAKIVFLLKGVRPRSWTERNRAKQSILFYVSLWGFLLVLLITVILIRTRGWNPTW